MYETMLNSSIIGIIIGTIVRMLPEIFKLAHKLIDNNHEKEMLRLSSIIDSNEIQDRYIQSNAEFDNDYLEIISKAQQKKSGFKYVDIIRALVRPYITYVLLALYVGMKIAYLCINPDARFDEIYTSDDIGIFNGVLSFWFLSRVLGR